MTTQYGACLHRYGKESYVGPCRICTILSSLNAGPSKIVSINRNYRPSGALFFECQRGHTFCATEQNIGAPDYVEGCPICHMEHLLNDGDNSRVLDPNMTYYNMHTRIRAHCRGFYHACAADGHDTGRRAAGGLCKNYKLCNTDFVVTMYALLYEPDSGVADCKAGHRHANKQVQDLTCVVRACEVVFNRRFDDQYYPCKFTAFSAELGLGIIHGADGYSMKTLRKTQDLCDKTGVKIVVLDAHCEGSQQVAGELARKLPDWLPYSPDAVGYAMQKMCKTLNSENMYFPISLRPLDIVGPDGTHTRSTNRFGPSARPVRGVGWSQVFAQSVCSEAFEAWCRACASYVVPAPGYSKNKKEMAALRAAAVIWRQTH